MREDISANLLALQGLHRRFAADLLLIESGGDNLAANYSRELADFIVYVIDVAGGDKVPRKGGPGITGSDLLVVNKVSYLQALIVTEAGASATVKDCCGIAQTSCWRRPPAVLLEGGEADAVARLIWRKPLVQILQLWSETQGGCGTCLCTHHIDFEAHNSGCSDGGPTIFAVVKHGKAVDDIVNLILSAWKTTGAYEISRKRWEQNGRKGSV